MLYYKFVLATLQLAVVTLGAVGEPLVQICGQCETSDPCFVSLAVASCTKDSEVIPSAFLSLWDFRSNDAIVGATSDMVDISHAFAAAEVDCAPTYDSAQAAVISLANFSRLFAANNVSVVRVDTITYFQRRGGASQPDNYLVVTNAVDYCGFGSEGGIHNYHYTGRLSYLRTAGTQWLQPGNRNAWFRASDCIVVYAKGNRALASCASASWATADLDVVARAEPNTTYQVDIFFTQRGSAGLFMEIRDYAALGTSECRISRKPSCISCSDADTDCPQTRAQCLLSACVDGTCTTRNAPNGTPCSVGNDAPCIQGSCVGGTCVAEQKVNCCAAAGCPCGGQHLDPCSRRVCSPALTCLTVPEADMTPCGTGGFCIAGICKYDVCTEVGSSPCTYANAQAPEPGPCMPTICGADHKCAYINAQDYTQCTPVEDPASLGYCYHGICIKHCSPEGWSSCHMPGESPTRFNFCNMRICVAGKCVYSQTPDMTECGPFMKCIAGTCMMLLENTSQH